VVATLLRGLALLAVVLVVGELRARTESLTAATDELESLRQALTPPRVPELHGLEAGVAFMPAEQGVSGDFYLLTNGPRATNIVIVGDVCGHGPEAAKRATFARATLASVAVNCEDPAEVLDLVNRTLVERWGGSDFLTVSCLIQDPARETLRWATGGHPTPIDLTDLVDLPAGAGPPLGLYPDAEFTSQERPLPPPRGVLLFTDGLLDARRGRERYGEQRLRHALGPCASAPPGQIVEALSRSVGSYADHTYPDDVCILALRAAAP
jgi:serine phosphatase RsbU (regulator of sigma subunit)